MPKQRHAVQSIGTSLRSRPGEGVGAIDVAVQVFIAPNGKSVTNFGLNLSQAPVPDRRYSAETCAIAYSRDTVKVVFAQERLDGKGLRTGVVLNISPRGIVQFLKSMDDNGIAAAAAADGGPPQPVEQVDREPDQVITLAANLILVAAAGRESCMDFYQASPFAMGVALQSHKLAVDAVVRVDLHTGLLLGLVETMRTVRLQFPEVQIWSVP
jgi:hypothetical protein